jgi:hypothetical protein
MTRPQGARHAFRGCNHNVVTQSTRLATIERRSHLHDRFVFTPHWAVPPWLLGAASTTGGKRKQRHCGEERYPES